MKRVQDDKSIKFQIFLASFMKNLLKNSKGVTLIELLIALVISAILVAGIYRVYISQQRSYAAQEQVADMQQNVRIAINRMLREIRMAGFGGKNENVNGSNDIINVFGNVNGFFNIVNPVNDASTIRGDNVGDSDEIVVLAAYDRLGRLDQNASAGATSITISYDGGTKFDTDVRRYLCIGGKDNYTVTNAPGGATVLDINPPLRRDYIVRDGNSNLITPETPVFLVRAIRYGLRWNGSVPVLFRDLYPNTGSTHRDTVAEYIENLQFRYVLVDGTEWDMPPNPIDIRGIRVTITARTQMSDPQIKEGGGFRRRTLNTYVDLRNLRDETP